MAAIIKEIIMSHETISRFRAVKQGAGALAPPPPPQSRETFYARVYAQLMRLLSQMAAR
jgi:hypothetical protein